MANRILHEVRGRLTQKNGIAEHLGDDFAEAHGPEFDDRVVEICKIQERFNGVRSSWEASAVNR